MHVKYLSLSAVVDVQVLLLRPLPDTVSVNALCGQNK